MFKFLPIALIATGAFSSVNSTNHRTCDFKGSLTEGIDVLVYNNSTDTKTNRIINKKQNNMLRVNIDTVDTKTQKFHAIIDFGANSEADFWEGWISIKNEKNGSNQVLTGLYQDLVTDMKEEYIYNKKYLNDVSLDDGASFGDHRVLAEIDFTKSTNIPVHDCREGSVHVTTKGFQYLDLDEGSKTVSGWVFSTITNF